MKKSIIILGSTLILTVIIITGCFSSSTKIKNAEDKVQEAKMDLAEAKTDLFLIKLDTISNYDQFKMEAEKLVIAQEKSMEEFKAWFESEKKGMDAEHEKRLAIMENKNNELKTKLADFKEDGQGTWIAFRNEFNRDMNELGNSLKDLFTVENKK
jgi:uncharacterized protein YpmB